MSFPKALLKRLFFFFLKHGFFNMYQKINFAPLYAFVAAFLVLTFFSTAKAQVTSNPPYTIEQSVIGSGGGTSSGGAGSIYKIEGAIGEPIAGTTSTNSFFSLKSGFFSAQVLAPTAATVQVSGRVITSAGKGIRNVAITMTDSSGTVRTTISTAFGRFQFSEVMAGDTYIFSVSAKRFAFTQPSQVFSIMEDINDIVFTGESLGLQVQ